jgi:hypothetical protein
MIDPAEVFQVSQVEMLPVSAEMIRRETQRDPTLSQVLKHVRLTFCWLTVQLLTQLQVSRHPCCLWEETYVQS